MQHRCIGALASPLVAPQHRPVTRMFAVLQRFAYNVCKRCRILQTQVGALSGQRMYRVGRVAKQRDADLYIFLRVAAK